MCMALWGRVEAPEGNVCSEAEVEATCARRLAVDGRWWRGGVGGVAALGWRGGGGFKIFVEKTA